MNKIKLTDSEIAHLYNFYEMELREVTLYVKQVKNILTKLRPVNEKVQNKHVRVKKVTHVKEKAQKSEEPTNIKSVQSLTLEPKKRGRRPIIKGISATQEPTLVPDIQPIVPPATVAKKPKKKRKVSFKRQGVYLSNWSKPLPRKPDMSQSETGDKD